MGVIAGSTIANNEGVLGASGLIVNQGAEAFVINSTIANNQNRFAGGIANAGEISVANSTITNNNGGLGAGGIVNQGDATLLSSIVANNTGGANVGDISGDGSSDGSNNLIGNGDDLNDTTGFLDTNIIGTVDNPINPLLGELQDNGGLTPTIALLEGSPAIDRG